MSLKRRFNKDQDYTDHKNTINASHGKKDISSPCKEKKGEGKSREAILSETKKKALNGHLTNCTKCSEALQEITEEVKNHKEAIKFLLSNSKQFQDEIQKEKKRTSKD